MSKPLLIDCVVDNGSYQYRFQYQPPGGGEGVVHGHKATTTVTNNHFLAAYSRPIHGAGPMLGLVFVNQGSGTWNVNLCTLTQMA